MSITDEFLKLKILIVKKDSFQRNNKWKPVFNEWLSNNVDLWKSLLNKYSCEEELWYYIRHPNKKPEDFVCKQCGKIIPYSMWSRHLEKNPIYFCSSLCAYQHRKQMYFEKTGLINPGQLKKSSEKIYYENHLSEFLCTSCGKQLTFNCRNNGLCKSCGYKKRHEDSVKNYYLNPKYCEYCGNLISFGRRTLKTCSKECSHKQSAEKSRITMLERYGVEHALQKEDFKKKQRKTSFERYGVENASSSQTIRQRVANTCLERYGVDNPTKSKKVVEKTKQTLIERYGVDCACSINKEDKVEKAINTKMKKYGTLAMNCHRFLYHNIKFDSKDELYFYIYNHDILKNNIKRGDVFTYVFEGKTHRYFCDFKIDNENIEIKGTHLFNDEDLYFPYIKQNKVNVNKMQNLYQAKSECMKRNNVRVILTESNEMKEIMSKVDEIFGKDYVKSFDIKNKKESKNQLF